MNFLGAQAKAAFTNSNTAILTMENNTKVNSQVNSQVKTLRSTLR